MYDGPRGRLWEQHQVLVPRWRLDSIALMALLVEQLAQPPAQFRDVALDVLEPLRR